MVACGKVMAELFVLDRISYTILFVIATDTSFSIEPQSTPPLGNNQAELSGNTTAGIAHAVVLEGWEGNTTRRNTSQVIGRFGLIVIRMLECNQLLSN